MRTGLWESLAEFAFGRPRSLPLRALRAVPAVTLTAWILYTAARTRPPGLAQLGSVMDLTPAVSYGMHFLAYVVLAAVMIWALWPNFRSAAWSLLLGWLLASVCGTIDELIQLLAPGRTGSLKDLAVDSLAALTVCALVCFVRLALKPKPIEATGRRQPTEGDAPAR